MASYPKIGFVLLVATGIGAVSQAQSVLQAAPIVTVSLEEVVVTARKIVEPLQKVPVTVTAFSGADLRNQSVRTLVDVQGQIPSLYLQEAVDDPQSLVVSLRGRKQIDATLTTDATVGTYIDGLYLPRTLGMEGGLLDVDRIEVLQGPQGTLYGRNTTGGAISLYTKNPTQDYGGSVQLTAGNYGLWNIVAIGNVPLNDTIAARVVVQRGADDGYGHNAAGQRLESEDSKYFRLKLRAIAGDNFEAVLSTHYESNNSGGAIVKLVSIAPPNGPFPQGGLVTLETAAETGLTIPQTVALLQSNVNRASTDFYNNGGTNPNFSDITKWDAALGLNITLPSAMQFRSITGIQSFTRSAAFGSPIEIPFLGDALHSDDKYYSQELQLLGSHSIFNWVSGIYAGLEQGNDDQVVIALPVLNPGSATTNVAVRNTSLAAFVQSTLEFVPTWRLTAGARYSYDIRQADENLFTTGGDGSTTCIVPAPGVESTAVGPSQCPRTFRSKFSEPSWLVSLDHQLTNDVLLYTKVAQGYRSGGQNASGGTEIETFTPFKPETNIEYEVGLKSEFLQRRLRFNLAAYLDKYKDLQVTTSFIAADGSLATAVTNAAAATIKGIEAESAFVVGGLTLKGTATFTDARYDRFTDFTGDRSHEPFDEPKYMASLSARYELPTQFGPLAFQSDWAWKYRTVLAPVAVDRDSVTQPSYGLLNARIDLYLTSSALDIAVFAKNITGVKYYVQANAHDNGSLGVNFAFAGAPAVFGLEITKSFGKN
jgi:iron complex outermembrane receptor protein